MVAQADRQIDRQTGRQRKLMCRPTCCALVFCTAAQSATEMLP